MLALYTIGLYLFRLGIGLAAVGNAKAKAWIDGRRNWRGRWKGQSGGTGHLVWFHCASLGEFEQGRPLIEQLKARRSDCRVLLTFFSPSGYELRKNYPKADYVAYLPLDTPANARDFLRLWQPCLAVFVKYEFWFNHLLELQRRKIPTVLVSGLFRPKQVFFQPFGRPFRRILEGFDHLLLQNEDSGDLLQRHGIEHYTVAGDTRIDRVWEIAQSANRYSLVEQFTQHAPTLVIGSSWPEDERHLFGLLHRGLPSDWKVILAPHDIQERHLRAIEKGLPLAHIRYTQAEKAEQLKDYRVLLIDNIGMLSSLYRYGRLAYIGGAFGAGLHNTLEPIAFGLPVIFGPKYQNFEEARYLVDQAGGFSVKDQNELEQVFQRLLDDTAYETAAIAARSYITQNRGASATSLQKLLQRLPD